MSNLEDNNLTPRTTNPASDQGENGAEKDQPVEGAGGSLADSDADSNWLDAYVSTFKNITEGEVIEGTVVAITNKEVMIDVGFKSEGIIPIEEFYDEKKTVTIKPGDKINVFLEQAEDSHGRMILSHEKAKRVKVWEEIERAYRDRTIIKGSVIERIKGGLAVDIGVRAFLPSSQIDLRPVRNLDSLRGEELQMKVIKVNKKRGNIVLSRKVVLEEELEQTKKKTLDRLEENRILEGTVKNITEYGAFIDLGGVDGLLHITDMSWGRINHPSELFSVGQKVKVNVIKFDREEGRVSLGYKQVTDDPWLLAPIKYPKGARVQGKVVNLTEYGAFVELEPGVEGLIHISEMSWNKRIKHPSKILNVGDTVEAVVLDIEATERKLSLGLKQTEQNPWEIVRDKYPVGSVVTGRVRNLTDFGAFVEIEEGVDGLVHISDISWMKRVKHPSEVLKKGERVSALVLGIDVANQKLSLGIKQLETGKLLETFFSQHQVGDVVKGKIISITSFGVFVELQEGVEGLCHISELEIPRGSNKRPERIEDKFSIGQEVEMKIIKLDREEKKIGLSLKAMREESDRSPSYLAQAENSGVRLEDHLEGRLDASPDTSKEKKEEGSL